MLYHIDSIYEKTYPRMINADSPKTLTELYHKLIRDMEMEGLSRALEVDFRWDIEPDSLTAVADPALLELALLSLLSNAVASAGPGGRVSLRLRSRNGLAIFIVGDSGPGLAGQALEESLGLGLQSARRVATLHRGTLVLENDEQGVCSVLSIPAAPKGQERVEAPKMGFLLTGGYSPILIELSHLLPTNCYELEDLE